MAERLLRFFDRGITFSFYLLFFLVPLTFTSTTSELFEFNKMWLTFGLTILIAFFWFGKMALKQELRIQRTPLDIPILLFLLSQIISTFHSLDSYVSFWGYYSRFNGGLLSTITYIFLYYAFVSNYYEHALTYVRKFLWASLFSGTIVALWGLPSHFGHDPTCYIFRGTFDVSCWTDAFQPKVRIFSTLGQPNWLAAQLSILLPVAFAFLIEQVKNSSTWTKKKILQVAFLATLLVIFYLDLLFTGSQSGFLGFGIGFLFLLIVLWRELLKTKSTKKFAALFKTSLGKLVTATVILLLLITFFVGSPISQLNVLTFSSLRAHFTASKTKVTPQQPKPQVFAGELGGTDSSKIRLIVWRGALDIFKHNPLFGTGVETFAFAYYHYRPAEHNLTSEWDFLYNKAHNEYLNYLATTGLFGLLTYLAIITLFLFQSIKYLLKTKAETKIMVAALIGGYISILISNFFGFSVVTVNIFFFLIPGFVLFLQNAILDKQHIAWTFGKADKTRVSLVQWGYMGILTLLAFFGISTLLQYWVADTAYALGYNLDRAGQYQSAYQPLHQAVIERPSEPTFQDELTYNDAVLALSFATQKDATSAASLAQEAIQVSNQLVQEHPNNVTFWKTRVRDFYLFSQMDPRYLPLAVQAIQKAAELAPTDAKVSYNLGILSAQNGDLNKAISTLENTIKLKSDYRDAYYALGLFYHDAAVDKNGQVTDPAKEEKAVKTMHYILDHLSPNDQQVTQALNSWGEK